MRSNIKATAMSSVGVGGLNPTGLSKEARRMPPQICLPAPTNVRLGIYPPPSADEVRASIHWLPSSILAGCPRAIWLPRWLN